MSVGIIQIPVLFDMSGDTVVFGEEATGDFVGSHLDFLLDMTTEANDISLNAADISAAILIGDQDTGDNIFYSGGSSGNVAVDNLCNRIAKAITRGKLLHIPKSGNHSNSGIPMGGRANLTNNLGELGSSYAIKYLTSVAPIGDEQMLGQAMARVASIHLVGSPLAAGIFEDKNQIQTDLETASSQTFNDGNTAFYNSLAVQLSKVLGGSKSSAPMNNGSGSGSGGSSGGGTVTPYDVASSNSTLTGQSYSASHEYASSNSADQAFNNVLDRGVIDSWRTGEFYGQNDAYTGSTQTTYDTNQTVNGEWLQVDIGQSVVLYEYRIWARNAGSTYGYLQGPKNAKLLSSNDGTTWSLVHTLTATAISGQTSAYHDGSDYVSVNSDISGESVTSRTARYFRLVTESTFETAASGRLGILELQMLGITETEYNAANSSSSSYPLDASGTSVPALKSIYEQLMNVPGRSQIMPTRDISGVQDNSNVTLTGGFPFISGDKLVMYLRPKIVFAAQTKAEQNTILITANGPIATTIDVPVYDIGRKSTAGGAISGQVYTESSSHDDSATWAFHKCFEGVYDDDEDWTTAGDSDHVYETNQSPDPGIKLYLGNIKTTNIDGTNELLGEWGQVDIGQNTVINKFQIWPRPSYRGSRSPSQFSLLGSLDGTNWTTIKAVTGLVPTDWNLGNGNTPDGTITWELDTVHGPYRYYRISIQSTVARGDGRVSLNGLVLFGAKSPSEVTTGSTGSVSDISGIETNIVATPENIEDAFPGNANSGNKPEINKWGWMGSTNSDTLSLETTDVTDPRTCDLHIWKITITL